MKYSTAILVLMIFAAAGSAYAQRKTITNADLEKYRQARLDADREYRENHVRLGLPSLEELAKRNEASRKEMLELSSKLRDQELEREKMRFESATRTVLFGIDRNSFEYRSGLAPAYYSGYYDLGRDRRPRFGQRRQFRQDYYISGGSIWPTGPRTISRPLIRVN